MVVGWKGARVTVLTPGSPSIYDLMNRLEMVRICYAEQQRSGLGSDFCLDLTPEGKAGGFGCRQIRSVGYPGRPGVARAWTDFGQLDADRAMFRTDKAALLRVLGESADYGMCRACPAFDWNRIETAVQQLPDAIKLEGNASVEVVDADPFTGQREGIRIRSEPRRIGVGAISFDLLGSRSQHREAEPLKAGHARRVPETRFSDVVGQAFAVEQIRSLVQLPLTHAEHFQAVGAEIHKGILLYGPPGNGKTLLARAAACESDAHLEVISGPELRSKWFGETEQKLREVFQRAEDLAPSIILIDEIDSIAGIRDADGQAKLAEVAQLLVLLDGLQPLRRVVVIGTTNRIGEVDPAIRRPGRFDYLLEVGPPSEADRLALIDLHLRRGRSEVGIADLQAAASVTDGWSGADLAGLVRESQLLAVKRAISDGRAPSETAVEAQDLRGALEQLQQKRG